MKLAWFVLVIVAVSEQSKADEKTCEEAIKSVLGPLDCITTLNAIATAKTECKNDTNSVRKLLNYGVVLDKICPDHKTCWDPLTKCAADFNKPEVKCIDQRLNLATACKTPKETCDEETQKKTVTALLETLPPLCVIGDLPCADNKTDAKVETCLNATKQICSDWERNKYAVNTLCTNGLSSIYNRNKTDCIWETVVDKMQYVEKPGDSTCQKEQKKYVEEKWTGENCKPLRDAIENVMFPKSDEDCSNSASGMTVHITLLVTATFMAVFKTIGSL